MMRKKTRNQKKKTRKLLKKSKEQKKERQMSVRQAPVSFFEKQFRTSAEYRSECLENERRGTFVKESCAGEIDEKR